MPCGLVMLLLVKVEVLVQHTVDIGILELRVFPLFVLTKKKRGGVVNLEMNLKNQTSLFLIGLA